MTPRPDEEIIRAVITDWSRDTREWTTNVGEAEAALDRLVAERDEIERNYDEHLSKRMDELEAAEADAEALREALRYVAVVGVAAAWKGGGPSGTVTNRKALEDGSSE